VCLFKIANEFGYSESEKDQKLGADLALGFFLVGAPAALLLGCLADSLNRVRLIAFVFALSGLACLATYFSRTYDELYVARIITGIGIGGSQPLVYSLLGDLFSTTERTLANTYVGLAAASGVAVGQLLAGELGSGKLGDAGLAGTQLLQLCRDHVTATSFHLAPAQLAEEIVKLLQKNARTPDHAQEQVRGWSGAG
jgi:MFS family permease